MFELATRFFDRTYIYKERIKKLQFIIEKKNSRIQLLKNKYLELKSQNEVLKNCLFELKTQKNQLNNEIEELKYEISRLRIKEETTPVNARVVSYIECNDEFEENIQEYKELFMKMSDSELLRKLMTGFGISFGDSRKVFISDMINFVRMIGNGVSFTDILYSYLEEKNSELGENERIFITELNLFYRKVYGLNYDVVLMPDSKLDNRFDKLTMKDNVKRNDVFKYYSAVYVPAILRKQNNIEKRAIVKAHN